MGTYAIDIQQLNPKASGLCEPVREWADSQNGRVQTDVQAVDEATGLGKWKVGILYQVTGFGGKVSMTTAEVTVPFDGIPTFQLGEPIPFEGLTVTFKVSEFNGKTSAREMLSARGIRVPARKGEGA